MGLILQMIPALFLIILQVDCVQGKYSFFLVLSTVVMFIHSVHLETTRTFQLLDMCLCFILLLYHFATIPICYHTNLQYKNSQTCLSERSVSG